MATPIDPARSLLLTDLYELTMLDAYRREGMEAVASFELFVRKLPPCRNFLVAAGLEQLVEFLENARFTEEELAWLESTGRFSRETLEYLRAFRFTGDLDALPEGTVFFADEPVVRVTAPLPQAQLVESRLINIVHFQVLIASKAARMTLAAPGKLLLDFGLRRAHGAEAGLMAARASFIAGFAGTATVPAEPLFGIPIYGTMAHSFIQAFANEREAFLAFARSRPKALILLIDTYDTEAAARLVVDLAPELAARGTPVAGVRIDSGDLAEHARRVRAILDEGGLREVKIFASGGIDEELLARHLAEGVPIDGYGIGTSLTTSTDWPALDCAYKLVAYAGEPRRKRSEGKATWPGAKQIFRRYEDGRMVGDRLGLAEERHEGTPLLVPVMRGGVRVGPLPGLAEARERCARELAALPERLRRLAPAEPYPVEPTPALLALAETCDRLQRERAR
ncbi:MAG: nicotinate phosphoribosyltransferase [Geminicoccaceae bacterium]|nr:nicotinate phosphoribosyltransferase [Geminicoccaceae bacterium]MCX7631359.1 nicotinate phosphoribosyltransferase [Geminicoccaceae bacterium]MDW8125324.1 nicotinate phosphoribosyltransferase [Geminicoccaceae bacterium]MDW8342648.1 nicotinate phosphoribosyltransferase [Geminicoccaceae bacterium]